ncbi:MAG: YdcF family protein [Candidatus Kerfeldbacteria bacterium]|nr:YdcF family protein [Candidatus Kerfeldbacteria bacterium]
MTRRSKIFFSIAVLAVLVLATPWPSDLFTVPLDANEPAEPVDALIVLGAGTKPGDDPLPNIAKWRMQRAVQLFADGISNAMLVSGGKHPRTGLIEAELMARYAVSLGVPEENIFEEPESRDTRQNAEFSLAFASAQNWQRLAVVTSDFHSWRSCAVFRKLKADIVCLTAPTRDPESDTVYDRLLRFRAIVREYGAIVYFKIKGYL